MLFFSRVENLKKFKSDEGDCPMLVCTNLAARGLDLDVDHVIMFDFPLNLVDYLHRTGKTARMGAKGGLDHLDCNQEDSSNVRTYRSVNPFNYTIILYTTRKIMQAYLRLKMSRFGAWSVLLHVVASLRIAVVIL